MKLALRKSEWLDDWYVVERAEHDGREWLRPVAGGFSFQRSARLGDADVEGTAAEMLALAAAIERGESESFRRCAVRRTADGYALSSPRNSTVSGDVSLDDATALAAEIRRVLGTAAGEGPPP